MGHAGTVPRAARPQMSHRRSLAMLGALALALLVSAALSARADAAGAFIDNGTIALGVGDRGHLIEPGGTPSAQGVTWLGLRYLPTNAEGLGTETNEYEGWGAADATSGITGYTSPVHPGMTKGVQLISFTHTANSATSVVDVFGAYTAPGAPPVLRVTHDFHPSSATQNLYEGTVTIENVSTQTVDPRYRRIMNWSAAPTRYDEYATVGGTAFPELLFSGNCPYDSPDPLQPSTHCGATPFHTGFFTDAGPTDEGALFDFGFDPLAPGESVTFLIYYGAAASEADAEQAVADVHAKTWSFGEPNTPNGPTLGTPNTFIFAFATAPAPAVANDLQLREVMPAVIDGPDQLDVRAELENTGTRDATNVETDVVLPPGLSLVTGSTQHAFNTTLTPGQEVDHTWRVSAPGACLDATYHVTVNATFSDQNGAGSFARTRDRDLLVRGTCAQIAGRVTDRNSHAAIPGAYVYACPQGGGACPPVTTTDAFGGYAVSGLTAGSYTLAVTGPGTYTPDARQVTLGAGDHPTEDFQLSDLHGPPPGTDLGPTIGTSQDGVPLLSTHTPTTVTGHGCAGATATFTVKGGATVLASGPMVESPAGTYTSAPFGPFSGTLTITTVIACQDGSTETTVFNAVYIDPSGTVRTTAGDAIPGATVTLLRSDSSGGAFTKVPDGDAAMSPANRKNSDVTDAVGRFGWDVIPGYYKVRASKAGCTAPDGADFVESPVMQIPPPVTDLDLRLRCSKQPPPTGGPATVVPPPKQPIGAGPRRKAVAAGVRISRRGTAIGLRLTCPKSASSACKVRVAMKLTRAKQRHGSGVVTLVTRSVTVKAGGTAKLTVRRPEIKVARKRLRLSVTTVTSAGTRAASYTITR
jgi:uncharacterized repeat protein (TIGR01451 family)